MAFVGVVAFSGFEATFSLLADARYSLHLSSTAAVFAGIGIVLVAVQGGLVGPVTERLGETGTIRFGLLADAAGLGLLAVDGGWALLVPALVLLTVGPGPADPDAVVRGGRPGRAPVGASGWAGSSPRAAWPGCSDRSSPVPCSSAPGSGGPTPWAPCWPCSPSPWCRRRRTASATALEPSPG